MTNFLLDTNIISDLVRNPNGSIMERIREVGESRVYTSAIVAAELRYGAVKRSSTRLTERVEAILGTLEVLPFAPPADRTYADLRARLERSGQMIGGNDLLIAAQSVSLSYVLVTDNGREFARIDEIQLANWLRNDQDLR